MAIETRVAQKEKLSELLRVRKAYQKENVVILPYLKDAISRAKSAMEAEDVAYVEKLVAEED